MEHSHDFSAEKEYLEKKLRYLKRENLQLKSKIEPKSEVISEQDLLSDIKHYKKLIKNLEDKLKNNQKTIKNSQKNIRKLELSSEAMDTQKMWNSNNEISKSKAFQQYLMLKKSSKSLLAKKNLLKITILKTAQQERLLQTSLDKPINDDFQVFVDASFLYKPSLKKLYR